MSRSKSKVPRTYKTKDGKQRAFKLYEKWKGMINRIENKNNSQFKDYGGRGIKVSREWRAYINFYEDVSKMYLDHVKKHGEKNTTLERVNVDKDYTLDNIRFATQEEQQNNRQNNLLITYRKKTQTLSRWARELKIPYNFIWYRYIRYRMSFSKIISLYRLLKKEKQKATMR